MQTTTWITAALTTLLGVAALADTGGSGSTGSGTTTTGPVNINFTYSCRGDEHSSTNGAGARVIAGTWDTTTGALNVTVTMTNCEGPGDLTVTGTDVITGTLVQGTTAGAYTINTTETINTKATEDDNSNTLTRTCTITRNGTFDHDTFTGTTTRNNCTLNGTYRENGQDIREVHLLENLLKRALNTEDD
ncbi:MAG: hypothetical protein JO218_05010 [Burkholderiales bacterium]|nr:hypothetical protein [Burkholderiales bacterium]